MSTEAREEARVEIKNQILHLHDVAGLDEDEIREVVDEAFQEAMVTLNI